FAEILTEFRTEVDKQKALERPEEDRQEAQARINEIYQQIKTIIQQLITEEEEEPLTIELEPGMEEENNQTEPE
ncbi:10261_t:CDS:1, partial [Ambispora leptoticha]